MSRRRKLRRPPYALTLDPETKLDSLFLLSNFLYLQEKEEKNGENILPLQPLLPNYRIKFIPLKVTEPPCYANLLYSLELLGLSITGI